jgi:hypothetical protein
MVTSFACETASLNQMLQSGCFGLSVRHPKRSTKYKTRLEIKANVLANHNVLPTPLPPAL